jgi:hypothetical protein
VLLDLWQPASPRPEDRENVELAVSFAATVVADACRRGGSNLFVSTTAPGGESLHGPASALLVNDVMEHLAVAEASDRDCLPELLQRAMAAVEPGTETVLVTTRAIEAGDARLTPLTADSQRRSGAPPIRVVNTSDPRLSDYFQTEE